MAIRSARATQAAATYLASESAPTGLVDGGEVNIGPGVNDVEILTGTGLIVDSYTDPNALPTTTLLSWPTINQAITAPAAAGSFVFYTMRPAAGNPPGPVTNTILGELQQYTTLPDPGVFRTEIRLGVTLHNGSIWKDISSCYVINSSAHALFEYVLGVLGPSYVIRGGVVTEAAAFTIDQTAGVIWELNRNWHVDRLNPHRQALPAATGIQWRYVNRDFSSVSALTSTVDPTQYDNGGTVESVPGGSGRTTIQRLYLDPGDNYWMLWGQDVAYDNAQDAASRVPNRMVINEILENSWLMGYLVVEKNRTDWDPDQAFIIYPQSISEVSV